MQFEEIKNNKTIFFCGSILNQNGLKRYKGSSPAASQWSKGLIKGIEENGIKVTVFAPIWDSLFPKGRLLPGKLKYLDNSFNQKIIKYLNFPGIRTFSIYFLLTRKIYKEIKNGIIPLAIINYNPTKYYCKAINKIKIIFPEIIWVNIVLDFDDPEKDSWLGFKKLTNSTDGHVFLSWWGFKHAPVKNKLHLDSGWDGICCSNENVNYQTKIFIYAGKIADYGGITEIINSIKLFPNTDVRFDFYGNGEHEGLNELAKYDQRVIIKGFVSDEDLNIACQNAYAFLAPQDVNSSSNKLTFPSKILFYLKFKKPIISQTLPGLSPDYNSVLIHPSENTAIGWAKTMKEVVELNLVEKQCIAIKSQKILEDKNWTLQAKYLIKFIESLSC